MFNKYIGLIVLGVSIGGSTLLVLTKPEPEKVEEEILPIEVQTLSLAPHSAQDQIIAHGSLTPRWQTTIKSEVNGRVEAVSEVLLVGSSFHEDQLLVRVECSDYQADLEQAKSDLASVLREFSQEQQRAQIAQRNWESSGIDGAASALTLRKPQLLELESAVVAARASVERAQYNLAQTHIRAPYDGIVVERMVNPGSVLQVGSEIAKIYDSSVYEISLALSDNQFGRLSKDPVGTEVHLADSENQIIGKGKIARLDQSIDATNRWRNLYIEVSDTEGMLPGQFVSVQIPGKTHDQALRVPEKYIGSNGKLWFVDEQNQLRELSADILYFDGRDAVISVDGTLPTPLLVTTNRGTYLPGVEVVPVGPKWAQSSNSKPESAETSL